MPRGSGLHLTKEGRKKINFTGKLKKKQDEKKYQQNQNQLRNNESTSTNKKKKKPTPAQELAKRNIKKYGGTAKAAAANKEAMRLKIKKKYLASKKKK